MHYFRKNDRFKEMINFVFCLITELTRDFICPSPPTERNIEHAVTAANQSCLAHCVTLNDDLQRVTV